MKKYVLILLLLPLKIFCQIPEPLPNTYVNDLANTMTIEQIHTLNEKILSIETKSSVQIAVILINKLPEKYSIEDYSLELGKKWHVGNAHNGLVYVAVVDEHKQRLEVADNLQGDIPDIESYGIMDNVKPFFRNKDYYGGVNELLDGINKRIDPVLKEQMKLAQAEKDKKDENTKQGFITFFLWLGSLFVGFIVIRFVFMRGYFQRKKEKKKQLEEEERKRNYDSFASSAVTGYMASSYINKSDDTYTPPPSYDSGSSYNSGSSSNDNGSSYGNWGSGSSDSSSSNDSGFSGGGSSSDW